jgi:hypothetical protein
MRRLVPALLAAVILVVANPASALGLDLNVVVGADLGGEFSTDVSIDSATGYTLGLELMFEVPVVELGVGAEYGFERSAQDTDADVSYVNVYAVGRLNFIGPLYAVARFGYSDLSADAIGDLSVDGGTSWSAGLGLKFFDRLRVEALFNRLSGSVDDQDLDYETWSLRAMWTF